MRWAAVLVVTGCVGGSEGSDPLMPAVAVPTGDPARALAVGRSPSGGVATAMTLELRDGVRVYDRTDAGETWSDVPVGVGPRAIAAVGDDFVTADTTGGTLTRIHGSDAGYTAARTGPIDPPPFHVAAVDDATIAVTLGTGDGAAVQLWSLPADPSAPPQPAGAALPLADATFAVAAPRGLVVVRRLAGDVVTAALEPDGSVTIAATTPICDEPRAATPLAGGDVAVACAGGVVFLGGRAPLAYAGNLYDLVAADLDSDGNDDLATVDLATHAAIVWYGEAPRVYPLSRGPIALRAADLAGDGDVDLMILAFEARALDILENRLH